MSHLPRPDWYAKPPEEWPSSAREFYRLCWAIRRRVQLKRAQLQAGAPAAPQAVHPDSGR